MEHYKYAQTTNYLSYLACIVLQTWQKICINMAQKNQQHRQNANKFNI